MLDSEQQEPCLHLHQGSASPLLAALPKQLSCTSLIWGCPVQLVDPGGSINTVWQAHPKHPPGGAGDAAVASPALGKLEIKWRGMLGDPGRLQTQQIQAPTPLPKVQSLCLGLAWFQAMELACQSLTGIHHSLALMGLLNIDGHIATAVPLGLIKGGQRFRAQVPNGPDPWAYPALLDQRSVLIYGRRGGATASSCDGHGGCCG